MARYEITGVRKSDPNDVTLPPMEVHSLEQVHAVQSAILRIYSGDSQFTTRLLTRELKNEKKGGV